MRVADAAPYRGKRVRMSAWVKTRGATERADFWGRVQAADSPGDGPGLGGRWTRLPAASDWQSTQIVFDVAAQAATLNYGVGVAGPGDLWVDAPSLEVVGADVPITPMPERQVADAKFEGEQTVGVTGVGAPDHALSQDGAAVKVSPTVADPKRFVHVLRVEKADAYVGKTIKITFEVKADGSVSGGCVAKALGASQWVYMGRTFGTAFQEQPAGATNGFVTCELSLTVAEGARWILYGHASRGSGNVWVKGGSIAVP
jgi:hypothetical protein